MSHRGRLFALIALFLAPHLCTQAASLPLPKNTDGKPKISSSAGHAQGLWAVAKPEKRVLKLSVWFTAQDVDKELSSGAGLDQAVNWCKQYGATKVNLEAYGRGLYANRNTLMNAKSKFLKEGFEVASGVTTEDGPDNFSKFHCYTRKANQEELQRMFEYAASMFDEIVIDDWYFTNCQCEECTAARGSQTWPQYYSDLMCKMSRERVMGPAHVVNPKVKVIIKYPQWNDEYHLRGYDVVWESKIFDGIWAGTEARNFDFDKSQGYEIGYNAYFNMRWLATLGNVGGGWFDTGGTRTKVPTYLEQARHTVLGGGKDMILWHYGGHLEATPKMEALGKELPGLIKLARLVQGKPARGVHLLKPGNSDPLEESWICSFLGNLGIPFLPASSVDERAKSAVFPVQALKDPGFPEALRRMLDQGTPVAITDGLAQRLSGQPTLLENKKMTVLPVKGSPKTLLNLSREQIKPVRDKLLAPLGIKFDAPVKVELFLFGEDCLVVENINDQTVEATLDLPKVSRVSKMLTLPEDGGGADLAREGNRVTLRIAPHTLVAVDYR